MARNDLTQAWWILSQAIDRLLSCSDVPNWSIQVNRLKRAQDHLMLERAKRFGLPYTWVD